MTEELQVQESEQEQNQEPDLTSGQTDELLEELVDVDVTPLAVAFNYTARDIYANRRRRLSKWQRRNLLKRWFLIMLGSLPLLLIPPLLVVGLLMWGDVRQHPLFSQEALMGYFAGFLLWFIYLSVNFRELLLIIDLIGGRVKQVNGAVRVWGRYLLIGKYRFIIDEDALSLVRSGLRYRIFMLPRSRTLLSIEFSE